MADPALSITHESETQRQFVRLTLPCTVTIDGQRHDVKDMSSGGLAIRNLQGPHEKGERFTLILSLPFSGFSLDVTLSADIQYRDKKTALTGCRFIDLSAAQTSILSHIVRSYIAGDIVGGGDLLNIVARNNFVTVRQHQAANEQIPAQRIKMTALYSILILCGMGLTYLLFNNIAHRYFILHSPYGVVEAPRYDMAAPVGGIYHALLSTKIEKIEKGALIGVIADAGDTPAPNTKIFSPCDCYLSAHHAMNGQYIAAGAPLLSLIPASGQTGVSVLFPAADVRALPLGAPVRLTLGGSGVRLKGIISDLRASDRPVQTAAGTPSPATLLRITPDTPIDPALAGRPVQVDIPL